MDARKRYLIRKAVERLSVPLGRLKLKENRIICISHGGGSQYSDSPMYITEYLLKKGGYEIVWIVNDLEKFSFLKEKGIRIVKRRSLSEIWYLNTSKVCITNLFRFPPYLAMSPGQLRINTMHGGGAYKMLLSTNTDAEKVGRYDYLLARHNINRCNLCLSGSRATSEKVYRKELGYRGKILEKGLPRNDSLIRIDPADVRKVKEYFGTEGFRTALVMPTWRKDDSRQNIEIDYGRLVETLEKNYGGRWKVLLRLHHLSRIDISDILEKYPDAVLNATPYDNPQELLGAADLLITDYSSVIWDFALRKGPIILYVPDLASYNKERGFVIPPEKWMLHMAESEEKLFEIIETLPEAELTEASGRHLEAYGSFETGNATQAVCDYIEKKCKRIRA